MRFRHLLAPPASLVDPVQRHGPSVKRARGLPTMGKYCLLQASRSGSIRRLERMDVVAGTHAHLTVWTRVWNPFHRRLTKHLVWECTPKYHDDFAMGWSSHGINDLPHARFSKCRR
jgi:hypothetical protein